MTVSNVNVSAATISTYVYVATGGETSKSGADSNGATLSYTPGKEQVFLNGSLLVRSSDYTATDGSSITGLTALAVSDILEVLSFSPFNVANAVQASNFAAKGDVVAGTAAGTFTNLTVGNNGEALLANSSAATGLSYQPLNSAGKNAVINGGMDIFQRSSTPTTGINTAALTQAYVLDRWWVYSNGPAVTTSQQLTNDTTNLPSIQYCMRLQRQSGQTSTTATVWDSPVETKNAIMYAGKTVVFSFYARISSTAIAGTTLSAALFTGTGTDQSGLGGYTSSLQPINISPTLTTTWQRFNATATLGATITEFRTEFGVTWGTGTAGANDYVEITGVQLELGSVATTFSRAGGTFQGELALCQRYYYRTPTGTTSQGIGQGFAKSITVVLTQVPLLVTMRANPSTAIDAANLAVYNGTSTTITATVATVATSPNVVTVDCTGTGFTLATPYQLLTNSTAAYIGFSAEL